jgi:hypothetical protein
MKLTTKSYVNTPPVTLYPTSKSYVSRSSCLHPTRIRASIAGRSFMIHGICLPITHLNPCIIWHSGIMHRLVVRRRRQRYVTGLSPQSSRGYLELYSRVKSASSVVDGLGLAFCQSTVLLSLVPWMRKKKEKCNDEDGDKSIEEVAQVKHPFTRCVTSHGGFGKHCGEVRIEEYRMDLGRPCLNWLSIARFIAI